MNRFIILAAALCFLSAGLNGESLPERSTLILPRDSDIIVYHRSGVTFVLNRAKFINSRAADHIGKLSAGLRIVTAADDPAGFAVSERMETVLREVRQRIVNDEDLRNFYQYAESTVGHHQEVLTRMRELSVRSSGGILNSDDRELVQAEMDQLVREIDMQAYYASFNGLRVIPDLTVKGMGLDTLRAGDARSLDIIDRALERLIRIRARLGSNEVILRLRIEGKSGAYINLVQTQSRITDLEMAEEINSLVTTGTLIRTAYGTLVMQGK